MQEHDNPFIDSALTHILVVKHMPESLRFYTGVLKAELIREYGGTSAVLKFLDNWILLVTPGGPTADKPSIDFSINTLPNQIDHAFTIRVKDCHKSYKILKSRGANFITPPYDWGAEIRCFFRDPNGHLFEISQYKG